MRYTIKLLFCIGAFLYIRIPAHAESPSASPTPRPPGIITTMDDKCFQDLVGFFGSQYATCYCQYKCSVAEPWQLECAKTFANRYGLSFNAAVRYCGICFRLKELDPSCP